MTVNIIKYGQGVPTVFFHGWGFDKHIWLPLVPRLDRHLQLILVDLPGFGDTPALDWSVFKEQLLAQLPDKFAVAGWSLGGLYAQRLAIEEPARVSHLVGITTSPCFISDERWPALSKDIFKQFYNNLIKNPEKTLKDFVYLQVNKTKFPFNLPSSVNKEGLAAGLKILEQWDLRAGLQHFSKPSLFMFGNLDAIVPASIMKSMNELYPNFHYRMFRTAHMPFISRTELFVDELTRFIT